MKQNACAGLRPSGITNGMLWYVTVVLFLLSPLYTIMVRDQFWPRIQDVWARRSKSKLQARILKLERDLLVAKELPIHTGVERAMFANLQWLEMLIGIGVQSVLTGLFTLFDFFRTVLRPLPDALPSIAVDVVFAILIGGNYLVLFRYVTGLQRYRLPRSEAWRVNTQDEITQLRATLESRYAPVDK